MPHYCSMEIGMKIKAPILCAATGVSAWGLDKTFHRNDQDEPAILRSHLKGKLREAWRELGYDSEFIRKWLGWETGQEPDMRGKILFSDLLCQESIQDAANLHRIRIHHETGTAVEGALMTAEGIFKRGQLTTWKGRIDYPAADESEAKCLRDRVLVGLRWITALGSEKSIGFGRLVAVELLGEEHKTIQPIPALKNKKESINREFGLTLVAAEPLTIGSVRIKNNYLETQKMITGAIIKGALAQCIRRRLNIPDRSPIEPCREMDNAGLSTLAENFEAIRFTHAFPSSKEGVRPVVFPITLVNQGKADVALMDNPGLINGAAPAFCLDWKDPSGVDAAYGWGRPKTVATTRTEIEKQSRGSKAERLYTFEAVCPADTRDKPVFWTGDVVLPTDLTDEDNAKLRHELDWVIHRWFDRIGKRDSRLDRMALATAPSRPAVREGGRIRDGLCVITLQSDTLMLDPRQLSDGDRKTVVSVYKTYWDQISQGALTMKQHFATQKILGGYLGWRFRPKAEDAYYPFFLTAAGSVFVLEAVDSDRVEACCEKWKSEGLPPPGWAISEECYGKTTAGRLNWRRCPFTPENGFGEIKINLPCHWELQPGKQDGK